MRLLIADTRTLAHLGNWHGSGATNVSFCDALYVALAVSLELPLVPSVPG